MTTIDIPRPEVANSRRRPAGTAVTRRRVAAAEWIKLRSLRAPRWLVAATVLSIVAAGVSPALGVAFADAPPDAGGTDPTGGALSGVSFTQLLVGALGMVIVTSEYATRLIRATFAAVPARLPVLIGKAAVVAGVVFVGTLTAVVTAFLAAQAILSGAGVSISLSAPGVPRAVVGAALLLAATAVMGAAFGWLLRSTAGAMAALFVVLFVLPLLGLLSDRVNPYRPSNAGTAILQTTTAEGSLSPWVGLGLFAAYTVAVLAAAALLLQRRDA